MSYVESRKKKIKESRVSYKDIDFDDPKYDELFSAMRYNWGQFETDIGDNDVYTSFINGETAVHVKKGGKSPRLAIYSRTNSGRVQNFIDMKNIKGIYPSHSLGTLWFDMKNGDSVIITMK